MYLKILNTKNSLGLILIAFLYYILKLALLPLIRFVGDYRDTVFSIITAINEIWFTLFSNSKNTEYC